MEEKKKYSQEVPVGRSWERRFLATDLGSAVSNVVLRIVGQSVACASLGHFLPVGSLVRDTLS